PKRKAGPIPEDGHWRRGRDELLEQLESLPGRLDGLKAQPREVPARVSETLDEPLPHRVFGASHDDRDRRSRLFGRLGRRCVPRKDYKIHLETDELGDEGRVALGPAFCPARLGHEMLSVHVAELAQPTQERACEMAPGLGTDHGGGHPRSEDPDPKHLARGLGGGGGGHQEGPEDKTADEGAPIHQSTPCSARRMLRVWQRHSTRPNEHRSWPRWSITAYSTIWFARRRTDCGIATPMERAVLTLTTSSTVVTCSTGRSAGLAPLRMRST